MLNFDFCSPTHYYYGQGVERQIGALLKPYAKKVLLHYGGGSIKQSGLYATVTASLKESGIQYVELGGVKPNPRLSLVHEGIALCKRENVDLILAVGGGSTIDSSKAIAMGVYYDGDVWDVYDQGLPIEKALPVAVVLTIPAAGSEGSNGSVITNEQTERKYGYLNPRLRPLLSVVDPELFFTLPQNQIANGAADIMSHVFERYFTNTTHVDLTDGLCETVLRTMLKNAPLVFSDPRNYDAWCEVAFSGTLAHNGLVGSGREEDWACHGMEHELSAMYDVAHGAGLALLTPYWMQYVYQSNINMFVQFAVNVMGVQGSFRDPDAIVLEGIARLRAFFVRLGLPATLRDLGIDGSNLELMAKRATGAAFGPETPLGGLKKLYWQDVLAIYQLAQ